jgi:hypothetical protein
MRLTGAQTRRFAFASGIIMEIRYLVDCRPDLHFTLNVLTKSMHKPTKRLEELAHRTLGYLL